MLRSEQEDVDLSVGDLIYDCGLGLKGMILKIRPREESFGAPYRVLYESLTPTEEGHIEWVMRHDLELLDNQTVRKRDEAVHN